MNALVMRRLRRAALWAAVAFAPALALPAQELPADPRQEPFVLGRRVKIGAPIFGAYEVIGTIDSLIGDLVVLDTMLPRDRRGLFDGGTIPVEQFRRIRMRVGDIKQVWVSDGVARTSAVVRYALYGGLGAGLLFGVSGSSQYNPTFKEMREAAIPGFIAGATVGAIIGAYNGRERWRLVPGPYYLDSPPVGRPPR